MSLGDGALILVGMTRLKVLNLSTSPQHRMSDGQYCKLRGFHSSIIECSGGLGCDAVLGGHRSKLHEPQKIEICSFETPGTRHPAMQRHILEEWTLRGLFL